MKDMSSSCITLIIILLSMDTTQFYAEVTRARERERERERRERKRERTRGGRADRNADDACGT